MSRSEISDKDRANPRLAEVATKRTVPAGISAAIGAVAGTIAASKNGIGVSGVAPDVSIVNVRAGQDSGYFFVGPTVNALTYSADAGLDVVNMSFYVDPWAYYCQGGAPEDSPEEAARAEHGDAVVAYEYNLAGNGKSSILGTGGIVKLVREKDGPIIGVHAVGRRMGEQIGEAQLIVNWEAYPEDVAKLIHAHPTQNESLGEAAMMLAEHPLHG